MSSISIHSSISRGALFLAGRLLAAFRAYQIHRQHRRAAWRLAAMNDHMLKDLGISRCEIHGLVHRLPSDRRCDADKAERPGSLMSITPRLAGWRLICSAGPGEAFAARRKHAGLRRVWTKPGRA